MPETKIHLVPRRNPQLQSVNERIGALAGQKPFGELYRAFSLAAWLAGEAIQAAEELQQMPGIDLRAFEDPLHFWHRVRDYQRNSRFELYRVETRRSRRH
jgi:hypothetical protein